MDGHRSVLSGARRIWRCGSSEIDKREVCRSRDRRICRFVNAEIDKCVVL